MLVSRRNSNWHLSEASETRNFNVKQTIRKLSVVATSIAAAAAIAIFRQLFEQFQSQRC